MLIILKIDVKVSVRVRCLKKQMTDQLRLFGTLTIITSQSVMRYEAHMSNKRICSGVLFQVHTLSYCISAHKNTSGWPARRSCPQPIVQQQCLTTVRNRKTRSTVFLKTSRLSEKALLPDSLALHEPYLNNLLIVSTRHTSPENTRKCLNVTQLLLLLGSLRQ